MTRPEPGPHPDPAPDPSQHPAADPVLDAADATYAAGTSLLSAASRRAFIAGAGAVTVAGAAAVAAGTGAATAGAAAAAAAVTTSGEHTPAAGLGGPSVVAYVRDLATGEVQLMSGEREVVVRDRALARNLARHLDAKEG